MGDEHKHNESHDHSHGHGPGCHGHGGGSKKSMLIALVMTTTFMVVEAIGGYLSNSLALISDAGHMFTDAAALGMGFFAIKLGEKPPSMTKSFGYRRIEIVAALLNGLALWAVVGVILHEAWGRITSPEEIHPLGMVSVAFIGLLVNLVSIKMLHSHKDESLNVKGAFLHVVADTMGSVGALVAGLIVWGTGWTVVDPLVSLAICALILLSSWGLIKDAVNILLMGVPGHINYLKVEEEMLRTEGVCCVYDLHIWSITPGNEAMSAHVVVEEELKEKGALLDSLGVMLRDKFGIGHSTIQIESGHEAVRGHDDALCNVAGATGKCAPSVVEIEKEDGHGHAH